MSRIQRTQIKSRQRYMELGLTALLLCLAACASAPPASPSATRASVAVLGPTLTGTAAVAASPAPTQAPLPSKTPSPTATPSSTPSPTPTLHPMMIEAMRRREYPGSDIVFEAELDLGLNYSRHFVSYQSEGLKIYALLTIPNGEPPATGWPVIVFNHGFIPPEVYRTTERYVNYVGRLAESG